MQINDEHTTVKINTTEKETISLTALVSEKHESGSICKDCINSNWFSDTNKNTKNYCKTLFMISHHHSREILRHSENLAIKFHTSPLVECEGFSPKS